MQERLSLGVGLECRRSEALAAHVNVARMYDFIIAMLLTLTPYHGDVETAEQRQDRLSIIATAIETATKEIKWSGPKRELAALLVAQGYSESKFALHIHSGNCRVKQGECDGGRAGNPWQIQYGSWYPKHLWEKTKGVDLKATTLAALRAARVLTLGRNRCKSVMGAISLYATGRTCAWGGALKRARFWSKLLRVSSLR